MSQAKRVTVSDSAAQTTAAVRPLQNAGVTGSVPVLSFPVTADLPQLTALTDKRSAYASVARTCLQLNQFAGSGSSAAASDDDSNALFHDATYAKTISASHAALIECAQGHDDRRCRILACKTLALVARAAYARLRHTPLLFSVREGTLFRLEDEVGTDVPVALCNVAFEDVDDGVSACAVEALGTLTLSNVGMVGTSVEDVLLREVEAIAHVRPSPHAPTLMLLEDEDYCTAMLELQSRVYENVLSPRMWRLVRRILHYGSSSHLMRTIPFLTACLGHLVVHTTPFGMDRTDYAKRWIEVDSLAMIHDVVESLLLPAMQQNDSGLAHAASLCALRLAHVCPNASWVPEVCPWAVSVLVEEVVASEIVEQKMAALATLLIALRAIPLPERISTLEFVMNEVRFLPSTTRVPRDVVSPGILLPDNGSYRRPARIGFLTELALSFFVDGTNAASLDAGGEEVMNIRSTALRKFLTSVEVIATLTPRSGKKKKKTHRLNSNQSTASSTAERLVNANAPGGKTPSEEFVGTHVGEEVVLAFCQVASLVGKRVMMPRDATHPSSRDLEDWLRCSLAVLSCFSSCINWRSRTLETSLKEEDSDTQTLFTVLTAAQASYIRLFQECLYTVGLLSPSSSVSLHLMPHAVPPNLILLEELAQATVSLSRYEPVRGVDFAHKDLIILVDQFLEYKIREGVPSRHIRVSLLALLTDHWVQNCHFATMRSSNGSGAERPGSMSMNELNARELLATLSEQISKLSKEMAEEPRKGKDDAQYLAVCVACIENIALTACDWARRFGSNRASNVAFQMDIEEDARYIVSVALAALDGKNLRDGDVLDEDEATDSRTKPMLPLCVEAARRIQAIAGAGSPTQVDAFGIGGQTPALFSTLVTVARLNLKLGLPYTPYLSASASLGGDASHHAYLAQYCQQVIISRFDLAMWSSPLADTEEEEDSAKNRLSSESVGEDRRREASQAIRAKNSLRLSVPPLPSSRQPKVTWGLGAKMLWKGSSSMVTAGSDPVAVVLSHTTSRCPRYDCEPEYRLHITMRLHNITAVEISKGVRMELSVTQQLPSASSGSSNTYGDIGECDIYYSTSAMYKHEVKAGDHLIWEISLPDVPSAGSIMLHPSVTFRELDADHSSEKWVNLEGDKGGSTENAEAKANAEEEDETLDITLLGEPIALSTMVALQPDPLVFFRDGLGDESVFRFLWLQLPYQVAPLELEPVDKVGASPDDELADAVAKLSMVTLQDWIEPTANQANGWAFMTLCGKRLFCVITTSTDSDEAETATLQFRADDEKLVKYLVDDRLAGVIGALTSEKWRCAERTSDEQRHQPVLVLI